MPPTLKEIRQRKLAERESKNRFATDQNSQFLSSADQDNLALLGAKLIQSEISARRLSRESYLTLLIQRTRNIGRHTLNAVTEELYDDALRTAQDMEDSTATVYNKNQSIINALATNDFRLFI